MKNEVLVFSNVRYIDFQPGDATRYEGYAVLVGPKKWVVSFPNWHSSYYVNEGMHLDAGYVEEKFCPKPNPSNSHTAKMMARAIALLVPNCTALQEDA